MVAGYLVLENVFFLIERLYENLLSLESTSAALTFDDVVKFIVEEKIEDCFSILVINPIDLAFVNKVYGFEVGDSILEEVINGLSILADRKRVVKCNEGLICAFLNDCSRSAAVNGKKVFKGIKETLSRKFSYLPYKPDISGYLLIFTEKSTLKINDLTNLLKYALRISRQKPSELLILSTDELISSKSIFVFKNTVDYLKETFESGRVALAIQGIHEIETAKVKHYEVLFRLIDEAGRIIPAGEVIDLIYDFRLIHLLDLAVLKKVFSNIEKFKNLNKGIFINVSPRTLKLRTTREEIEKIIGNLVRKGLKVGFEITEQAAIEDFNVIVDFFTKLPTKLAIDDFGTGYSSFSNFISLVEQLPIRYLKIDGSYVKKLEESVKTEKVIGALNSMAHSLGIETIAEFASSWEIVEKLKKLNIDYAQGFFFSKPEIVVV
jgi:EAL domain-containing protein (putative c-di-GMP-specific phosphodiesterase class I)